MFASICHAIFLNIIGSLRFSLFLVLILILSYESIFRKALAMSLSFASAFSPTMVQQMDIICLVMCTDVIVIKVLFHLFRIDFESFFFSCDLI